MSAPSIAPWLVDGLLERVRLVFERAAVEERRAIGEFTKVDGEPGSESPWP